MAESLFPEEICPAPAIFRAEVMMAAIACITSAPVQHPRSESIVAAGIPLHPGILCLSLVAVKLLELGNRHRTVTIQISRTMTRGNLHGTGSSGSSGPGKQRGNGRNQKAFHHLSLNSSISQTPKLFGFQP